MSLQIECIRDPRQLSESVRDQWNRLSLPSPMQSADWLLGWWESFGQWEKDQLCILLVFDDDLLVAVAPWYLCHQWTQVICLRFLGDGIACSDHSTVVIRQEYIETVLTIIARWLRHEAGQSFQSIQFESIDDDDRTIKGLVQKLGEFGCDAHLRDSAGCWVVDLPPTWEDFLASLSKNHRKRCRRWQREYFDSGRAEVVRAPIAGVAEAWSELAILNQQRRQQLGDRSAFADERFQHFHLSVLPNLMAERTAELRELRIDGELVAVEYVFFRDGTVFCYQSGMKANAQRMGPGNLSIMALFRDAIQVGRTRLDFLRGDEDYKQRWGARRTGCIDYYVAPKSLTGSVHVAYYRAVDWMRTIRDSLIETPDYAARG